MATNHTSHYQLNQWAAEDAVLRSDFNEDNQKIDSAIYNSTQTLQAQINTLLARPTHRIVDYTGDGATSHEIDLGIAGRLAIIVGLDDSTIGGAVLVSTYGAVYWLNWVTNICSTTDIHLTGTKLLLASGSFNTSGKTYRCIAFS